MVENNRDTKTVSGENNIQRYTGVASINILAINPNNAKLRSYGWQIADGAEEPVYTSLTERNGKQVNTGRVRFLVQLCDLQDKPVIALDFWCHSSYEVNNNGDKCKIIDSFGRTAWATKDDIKAKRVPQYANGPASISTPYTLCHEGEETMVQFLIKYLNITPFRVFDRNKNEFVEAKNPGRLTIDNWDAICNGNIGEIAEDIALQPDNRVKVILGVRKTDDNKTYQTFFTGGFISNSSFPDKITGEYTQARKMIDKFFADGRHPQYSFTAMPVKEWKETATEVQEVQQDLFDVPQQSFDEPQTFESQDDNDDQLPF